MKLREIIAEYLYIKDGLAKFDVADSNTRDLYFRKATDIMPSLLSGFLGSKGNITKIIRGQIKSFILAHGNTLTIQNSDSLVRRIVDSIKGDIKSDSIRGR